MSVSSGVLSGLKCSEFGAVTLIQHFFSGLRNFWQKGNDSYLFHRGIIAVKEQFTLQPSSTTKCEAQNVTCVLKVGRNQEKILNGRCDSGWSINASDFWNCSHGAKLVCQTQRNAKWHFYVFPFGKPAIYFPPLRNNKTLLLFSSKG